MGERTRLTAPEATPAPPQKRVYIGPMGVPALMPAPAQAPAPALPKGAEGPAPAPEANKEEEPPELASIELTLTPMNLSWPKGPGFYSPGVCAGLPFHILDRPKFSLDIGPSVGFDFHFGDSPVLPQTA